MDARSRYSIMVIQNSFYQLLREKPVNKITVTEICELSQINRATFYRYYSDPYELLQRIEEGLIGEMEQLVGGAREETLPEMIDVVLDIIRENYDRYSVLFSENGDSTFPARILALCYQVSQPQLKAILPGLTETQQEWIYFFIAQGCSGILQRWVRGGMRESPAEISGFMQKLSHTILEGMRA